VHDLVRAAFLMAVEKHKHQTYGAVPYIVHLFDVVEVLRFYGHDDQNLLAAAWLHDVLEDTPCHYSEVKRRVSKQVADIVYDLTDELARSREARQIKTLPKVQGSKAAKTVKLADWIANLRACNRDRPDLFQMYLRDFEDFQTACRCADDEGLEQMWAVLLGWLEDR